jgi:hypothetical protein
LLAHSGHSPTACESFSLIGQASNHTAAWSIFSNGQSVENMMRSAPISSMVLSSAGVWKLPDVVT